MVEVKLGLIGGGYWGKNLVREFNNCGVLRIICDINKEMLLKYNQEYPTIETTTDWNYVLNNDNITAVCIALPAEMHYEFAKKSLLHNKDVYVEKPITLNSSEAEELIEIAKKNDKILMVGHLLHYHPCIKKIKEIIKKGEIGKIINIVSNRLNLGIFRTQENVLWSFAPHDISVILSFCDDELPDIITCHGKDTITSGIHDITNTILEWKNKNIYANINVNWLNPFKEQKLTIIGEKGMILFDDTLKENKLSIYKKYIEWTSTIPSRPLPVKNDGEYLEYDSTKSPLLIECEHFIHCCKTREKPITDGEEGLRVLKVLNYSTESLLQNGQKIFINQDIKKNYIDNLNYFVHKSAVVDPGAEIGDGTKIWHFSHICKDSKIGKNCNIGQNVFIAGNSILGDGCKIQNNVSVYSGVECGNYVFLGPSCVLTNDINPRTAHPKGGNYIKTIIEDGATIGANATIVCGNKIGKYSLVGAGAVVTKDVEPYSIVVGNPAKKIGTINEYGERILEKL